MRGLIRRVFSYIFHRFSFFYLMYSSCFRLMNKDRHKERMVSAFFLIRSIQDMLVRLKNEDAIIYNENTLKCYEDKPEKTILLISHELTLTGAPIVLLHMAEFLIKQNYQTIVISFKDDEGLAPYAEKMGIPLIVYHNELRGDYIFSIRKLFSRIIVNTITCADIIRSLCNTDSKVLWWIHEAAQTYTRESAKALPQIVTNNIHIYSVGPYAKTMLLNRYPKYYSKNLLYYSPDVSRFGWSNNVLTIDHDKMVYANIGSIGLRKGQDILIDAIYKLSDEVVKGSVFLFIGKIVNKDVLKKLKILTYNYPQNVIWTGKLRLEEVYRIYSDVDYLICSSRDDPMPVVIAEAMSMAIPSICSEFTGSASIIHNYSAGFWYRFNSSARLAKEIEKSYYLDDKTYREMSINSRKAYERFFSENAFSKHIGKIIHEQ